MIDTVKASLPIVLIALSVMATPQMEGPSHAQGNEWRIDIVDSEGFVGVWNSIALDSMGYPHISYQRVDLQDLKYAKWTGFGWSNETVDSTGKVGAFSSIAIDGSDNPHISYRGGGDLKYAKWNGSAWEIEVVDFEGDVGRHTSIVLDGNGYPRISYARSYGFPGGHSHDLKYSYWDGSAWHIEVVEHVDSFISRTSLALDGEEYPHISYGPSVGGNYTLKYARWDGSTWNVETVDADGDVGLHNSIDLDDDGYPHIGYYDRSNGDLKYAWWNGTSWNIEIVDSEGKVGSETSMALDSNDYPHIGYFDVDNGYSKYAWWNGTVWNNETIDPSGGLCQMFSIALDSGDYPHLSYVDYVNGDLKYATKAELAPPPRTISFDLDPDTLNLKSKGRWVTAYLSTENASVRDIDISTVLLQDTLQAERYDYQGDVLMLKFNRNQLQRILPTGESVEVKISGKWNDGSVFEAYDYIRVINPPMIQLPPRFRNPPSRPVCCSSNDMLWS